MSRVSSEYLAKDLEDFYNNNLRNPVDDNEHYYRTEVVKWCAEVLEQLGVIEREDVRTAINSADGLPVLDYDDV